MAVLSAIKERLGITGNFQDKLIESYIDDVKAFCIDAGVNVTLLDTPLCYGLISRGVMDLWEAVGGTGEFSPIFHQRLIQVASMETDTVYTDGYSIDPQTHDITLQTVGKDMMDNITVKAVTASIDADIRPENIVDGVEILGVHGTAREIYPEYNGPTTVTPTTDAQTLATTKKSLEKDVTIEGVTAAVDLNIKPENIRHGVNILGVDGAVEERLPAYIGPHDKDPQTFPQTFKTNGKSLATDLTVNAVTAAVDSNIKPENIKSGVAILGVKGTADEILPDYAGPATVSPKTELQTLKTGNTSVRTDITVDAVTASIDTNIVPSNIRKGVSILGVDGDLIEGGGRLPDYEGVYAVSPTTQEQTLATNGKSMTGDVIVSAVTKAIDPNIQPENIKNGVSILGVDGTAPEPAPAYTGDTSVQPGKNAQILNTANKTVSSDITVQAVTSAVDPNIISSNIKDGVEILGVLGTLETGGGPEVVTDMISGPVRFSSPTTVCFPSWANATNLEEVYAYTNITEVNDFSAPIIQDYAGHLFYNCKKLAKVIGFSVPKKYGDWSYKSGNSSYAGSPFDGCLALTTIGGIWNVGTASNLFYNVTKLSTILPGTKFMGFTNARRMFDGTGITAIPDESILPMAGMYNVEEMYANTNITEATFSAPSVSDALNAGHLFYNCKKLALVNGFNLPKAAGEWSYRSGNSSYAGSPFDGCPALTTIGGIWNVGTASNLFYNVTKLSTILPGTKFMGFTNARRMFSGTSLTEFPNSTVLPMDNMYNVEEMYSESDITRVDDFYAPTVSDNNNAGHIFYNCKKLTEIHGFRMPGMKWQWTYNRGRYVGSPFDGCPVLATISGEWETSGYGLFLYCDSIVTCTANFKNLVNAKTMFKGCTKMTDLAGIDCGKITDTTDMFRDCDALANLTDNPSVATPWNFKISVSFLNSPLTRESALKVLNGLQTVTTNQKITFSSTTNALLTAEDKAIAEGKGWTVA